MTGNDKPSAAKRRPTPPGETRFWCSCDPETPYLNAIELVEHVKESREREPAR